MAANTPRFDPNNFNLGTARGRAMLLKSLREQGAGRSILLDKDGVILAGNKTYEAAQALGLPVKVIESDGKALIAVKRIDVSHQTPEGRTLALTDNRVSEVGLAWDKALLAAFEDEIGDWFTQQELDALLRNAQEEPQEETPKEENEDTAFACPHCGCLIDFVGSKRRKGKRRSRKKHG